MSIKKCPKMGKVCFDNKDKASADANRIFKSNGVVLEVYKCPFCRSFHLTRKCLDKKIKITRLKTTYLHQYKQFIKFLA